MERCLKSLLTLLSIAVAPAFAVSAGAAPALPDDFTVEGRLYDSGGAPINSTVDFQLEIVDDAGSCVLYRETRTGVDLSSTDAQAQGVFSLRLGAGTVQYQSGVFTQLFAPGSLSGEGGCTAVPLSASTHRRARVMVQYSGGSGYEALSPDTLITSVPLAKVAETALNVQGVGTSGLLVLNGTTSLIQTSFDYLFSNANYTKLKALVDGTSGAYVTSNGTVANANNQRLTNLADPAAAQDAATKNYADSNLGGLALDDSGVGPATGGGKTLIWDQVANKWAAGTLSTAPTGSAGGALTGTYPNPTLANNSVNSAAINATGVGRNLLLMTDAVTGGSIGFASCPTNQVLVGGTGGFSCQSVASLSPVTSVATRTGAVTLTAADIAGLGTAALWDWGTTSGNIPRLDASARLPAVDGSQLLNVNATLLGGKPVQASTPAANQVLGWNAAATAWTPVAMSSTGVTSVTAGVGLTGGTILSSGTLNVNVGSNPSQVVQENTSGQIAQLNGSATTPSYSFANTPGSGMYSPGTGQVALATNGTSALNVSSSAFVGIGTSTPRLPLVVQGISNYGVMELVSPASQPSTISFRSADAGFTSSGAWQVGSVGGPYANFYVVNGSTGSRLAITPLGQIGIGTSAPSAVLDVASNGTIGGAIIVPRDTSANRPNGVNGMIRYNTTSNGLEGFVNGAWSTLSAGSAAGTVTNITTDATLTGGPITTTGTLKVNVGAAAGQIVQENANAQIAQALGSPSQPSYSFVGNLNTGVYSPGTGQLSLVTNGAAVVNVTPGGQVGFGLAPSYPVHIAGSAGSALRIDSSMAPSSGLYLGAASNSAFITNGLDYTGSSWMAYATNTSMIQQASGAISFFTDAGPTGGRSPTTRMTITPYGSIGIGTAYPSAILDVVGTGSLSALVVPRDTTSNRPTGLKGMIRYNTTLDLFEGYAGSAWSPFLSSSGTVNTIATDATLLGGPITTTGTLKVNVGISPNQIVQENANAQITQATGSAAQPAYTFSGNTNTGIYSPGPNQVAISANGTAALKVNASGDVWLTSTTPSTGFGSGALTVNGGLGVNGQVSAATTVMGLYLQSMFSDTTLYAPIGSTSYSPVPMAKGLDIRNSNNADGAFAGSRFDITNAAGSNQNAYVGAVATAGSGVVAPSLVFGLQSGTNAYAERMRISATGLVGIGTSAPAAALDVTAIGTMSALLVPRDTTTNRPTGVNGMIRYNTSNAALEGYVNGAWATLAAGASAGTVSNIATDATLIGGPITTTGTLKVNVGISPNQIVQENANAQITQATGSAAQPAYTFSGNTNTGIYSPGPNQVAISANGTAALSVAASGFAGFGLSTPGYRVHIASSLTPGLRIDSTNNAGSGLFLGAAYDSAYISNGLDYSGASWVAYANGTSMIQQNAGSMIFSTDMAATGARTPTPRMVINPYGLIGVGTNAPAAALDVATLGTTSALLVPRDTSVNRPAGVNGMIRYNTTNANFETYNGSWTALGANAAGAAGQIQYAGSNGTFQSSSGLTYTGSSGLSVTSPAGLTVTGTASFKGTVVQNVVADATTPTGVFDFSQGNVFTSSWGCGSGTNITVKNLQSGGTYTVMITDGGTTKCTFTSTDTPGYTFKFSPPNDVRTSGGPTIYNLLVINGVVYVTWSSGFN